MPAPPTYRPSRPRADWGWALTAAAASAAVASSSSSTCSSSGVVVGAAPLHHPTLTTVVTTAPLHPPSPPHSTLDHPADQVIQNWVTIPMIPRGGGRDPKKSSSSSRRSRPKAKRAFFSPPNDDDDDDDDHHHASGPSAPPFETNSSSTSSPEVPPPPETAPVVEEEGDSEETLASSSSSSSSSPPPQPWSELVQQILQQDDYYEILGLDSSSSSSSKKTTVDLAQLLKKAYRQRAVSTHPDKTGGDRRAFDKVARAYEVLSDDKLRSLYDKYGPAGLDPALLASSATSSSSSSYSVAEDFFRAFFGGNRRPNTGSTTRRRTPHNPTVRYQVEVTLEDLYQGAQRRIRIASPDGRPRGGKELDWDIPRGARHGQVMVLSGVMDLDRGETPGDLILILQQRPHATFVRRGHDLVLTVTCSWSEALCGVQRCVTHLDGRILHLASARQAGTTPVWIQSGDVQVWRGQGMPKNTRGTEFGDLYVHFYVKAPPGTSDTLEVSPSSSSSSMDSAERTCPLTWSEREELGRLVNKLEGRSSSGSESPKKWGRRSSKSKNQPEKEEEEEGVHYLETASLGDIGQASGPWPPGSDPEIHEGEPEEESPWASFFAQHPFFSQHHQDHHPRGFFGMNTPTPDEDGQVECRPM